MKLGFVTAILGDKDLEFVFQTASSIGYDCVEVMCWPKSKAERRYAGVTHIDVVNMNQSSVEKIKNLTGTYGVEISALGYYPNLLSPKKEEAEVAYEHIFKVIDAAASLDLKVVNTFIGRDWNLSVEENLELVGKIWPTILTYAKDRNILIGIENCPMIFTKDEWPGGKNLMSSPHNWDKVFNLLNMDNLGLNFDPSHFIWQQMDYEQAIMSYGEKIFHAHAKDARLDREKLATKGIMSYPNEYHTPKLPGLGDVDWGKFFSRLSDSGYKGPICVEVEDRAFEGSLEDRIESLKISYSFLRQYIPK